MAAKIRHPSSSETEGPFLIDRKSLEALDTIVERESAKLTALGAAELAEEVSKQFAEDRKKNYNEPLSDKELRSQIEDRLLDRGFDAQFYLTLSLEGRRTVNMPTFYAALRDPDLDNHTVTGFHLQRRSAQRTFSISLRGRDSGTIEVEVGPEGDALSAEILVELRSWQESVKPSWWLKLWRNIRFLHLFLFLFTMLVVAFVAKNHNEETARDLLKSQGADLIAKGIQPGNYGTALSILLKADLNLSDVVPAKLPKWYYGLGVVGGIYCVLLSFCPGAIIAIGTGSRRLHVWRLYTTFVAVTIPTAVFLYLIFPALLSRAGALFQN